MMHVAKPIRLFAALVMLTGASAALAGGKPVVELFTSQGCNSCPPADELLGKLAASAGVIPLTLSVDYWDYLGWRDTLALNAHTQRQKSYARARGDMNVYTPQAIVNGTLQTIGSERTHIEAAIKRAAVTTGAELPVQLRSDGNNIAIEIGAGQGNATVWLLAVTSKVKVAITRGENRGSTITYSNVVRAWRNLGSFTGARKTVSIPVAEITKHDADAAVLIVQSGPENAPGAIRAAEIITLR